MIPFLTANSTSSPTEWIFNFLIILLRCVSAVLQLIPKSIAVSFVDFPSATNCTTSRSRGLNPGTLSPLLTLFTNSRYPASTISEARAVKNVFENCSA